MIARHMQRRRVSILGVGLLGGSIGLALRKPPSDWQVVGYGHRPQTLEIALNLGAIDESATDPASAVKDADLVILCTPVGLFGPLLDRISGSLKSGAIVTDVGSTKRTVVAEAAKKLPKSVHFVGSHPMAGSEKRGVEYARADLFKNAVCIVTPTPETNDDAVHAVESFWHTLGMRVARMSPDDHDHSVAAVSHLPHITAAALVSIQTESSLRVAGKGFLDSTRIAAGDATMWRDILLDNHDCIIKGVENLKQQLDDLLKRLKTQDGDAIHRWLADAAKRRDDWQHRKATEPGPE